MFLPVHVIEAAVAEPAQMAKVLGSVADWKITPAQPVVGGTKGETTLSAPEGLSLETISKQNAPCELLMSYRLKPAEGASASVSAHMACGERPDKTPQSLNCSINTTGGSKFVNYYVTTEGGKVPPPFIGNLYFEAVTERSLAWSEEMRKAIEAQIASAPKVEETLHTLRCTVEKGRFRCWVNGRFVNETALPADMDLSGLVKVEISPGAELASIRVRPLPAADARFEPLSIAGHLNAKALGWEVVVEGAKRMGRDPERAVNLDGVPFQFAAPNAKAETHMDVGQSWTRFGALPGYFAANSGTFGGRWISADHLDPSRLAMYIPPGRYKALHLIAVSDDLPDHVPVVTAQFYRPDAGHPVNFSGTVPTLKGKGRPVTAPLGSYVDASLHHVTIPLDPDGFSWFSDLGRIGLEITKQVQFYRPYPDPLESSWHGAGLPSSAQIYAMTLERAGVDVDIQPEQYAHIWTAPAQPGYNITLRNSTGTATKAKLVITTRGSDGQDPTSQEKEVDLPADGAPVKVPVTLKPTRYGLHDLGVSVSAGNETVVHHRNFAYLHPDTRERGGWQEGRGAIFGYWPWGGAHDTPSVEHEISTMSIAGAETSTSNYSLAPGELKTLEEGKAVDEIRNRKAIAALAEKHHFISESAFNGGMFYYTAFTSGGEDAPKFDPAKPEESGKNLIKFLKKYKCEPGPISRPTYVPFFAEAQVGPITMGTWPHHWGEEYQLTKAEQDQFQDMLSKFLVGARAIRKEWPKIKLLLPYGDPMVAAVFMKLSPESRDLIDGCAMDLPVFERLPEQQVHQVVLNRLYPIMKDIHEYKRAKDFYTVLIEGTHTSSKDIDTGEKGQADISTRNFLTLMGYGLTRFESGNSAFDCANWWGENHYGGGWCNRLPLTTPKPAYVNYATITRHLNRANFTKYVPTGSTSTFCQQFKHYKSGKLIHVLWTIRGKRPVSVKVPAGSSLEIYDGNDNATVLKEKDGVVTFTVDQSPQYLEGLKGDAVITLGESDHSDSQPAKEIQKIASLGDGSWNLVAKEDPEYTKNKPLQIERFPGKMSASVVEAPAGKALAIHLEKQDKDRGVMPFYTTLEPKAPITIPGKASHLGLWVRASSDWGRVVYSLRDAKGEKWISVGTKEEWNNDDIHSWSAFCFDGWRYLRFELPASAPYDCYREYGTAWWGSYGGDGVVDLPLKLEKIMVERRPKVVYGGDLVEAKADDVLLGDLNAEYASAADKTEEAVRLSKLRMPSPKGAPELGNPIADLAKTGVGAPTKVLKVTDPMHQYDGTRCHVHFDLVPGAKSYDVWVSPYPDGRGAIQLGTAVTESGALIEGLRPDVEFYLFIVSKDKDDKLSKPSAPFKFTLKDRFGYK